MARWSAAVPDWAERLAAGKSLLPDCPWDAAESKRALSVFGSLQLPDVAGNPYLKDAAGPWQHDLVRALFGSWDPDMYQRHFREFGVMVPKKNSKTTTGAAVMLTALLMSPRPRAEFLIVAPTQEISDVSFAQAVGMVQLSPYLLRRFHVQAGLKKITDRRTGCFLKVKSFSPDVLTGSKAAGILLDEIHVIADRLNADRVLGQIRGGMLSQPEAFLLTITTQSERPPSGVFLAELRKWRAVRDGRLNAAILPMLYEMPPGMDWRETGNWASVNPNNGYSMEVDRLVEEYLVADASGIDELRRWASQHLNVEVGLALRSDNWAGGEYWLQQGRHLPLDMVIELSDVLEIGIDGGGLDDMLGFCILGREASTGDWLCWSRAWVHPIALERRKSEANRLRDFAGLGELSIVDAIGEDVAEVAAICKRVADTGKLDKVGVDPVGIGSVLEALYAAGVDEKQVIGVPQGWRLSGAIKTTERRLAEGGLHHGGSSLMNWCVGNARVEARGNAIVVTKQGAGACKIDPLVALFNAAALMSMNPAPRLKVDDWIG